jgi:hypothetical protein
LRYGPPFLEKKQHLALAALGCESRALRLGRDKGKRSHRRALNILFQRIGKSRQHVFGHPFRHLWPMRAFE